MRDELLGEESQEDELERVLAQARLLAAKDQGQEAVKRRKN